MEIKHNKCNDCLGVKNCSWANDNIACYKFMTSEQEPMIKVSEVENLIRFFESRDQELEAGNIPVLVNKLKELLPKENK